jgi:signal transduction histidine kinase
MAIRDITQQKQAEQKLRSLASKLLLAGERERREIAVELHDHIGQTLAASKIKLGDLVSKHAVKFKKPLNEIRNLIDQAIQYTRSLTFDLSPPILYEIGLEAAIEWLAEKTQKEHGLAIDVQTQSSPLPVDHEIRILLFQIVRELLFNVVKYAKARSVQISVQGGIPTGGLWLKC